MTITISGNFKKCGVIAIKHGDSGQMNVDVDAQECGVGILHYSNQFYNQIFENLPILKNREARQAFLEIARSGVDRSSPETISKSFEGSRFKNLAEKAGQWVSFANGLFDLAGNLQPQNWPKLLDALTGY